MNSEELEMSLRSEFETYLKGLTDDMRREVADFQAKIETEFEKHKNQLDTAFREFSDHIGSEKEFDGVFSESVIEHLRLARDEGAQLAANAFADAEQLRESSETAARSSDVGYGQVRNAVSDISSKTSQATILRSLVEHASQFTARGVFFIVKNEMFVGWKVFGANSFAGDETVRAVEFSTSADTILAESVRSLAACSSAFRGSSDDTMFLEPLGFGQPDSMVAIPLMARGRGVAVLYADSGSDNSPINVEALETLVRVAGLTVELLASAQTVPAAEVTGSEAGEEHSNAAIYDEQPEVSQNVEAEYVHESSDNEYAYSDPEIAESAEDVYEIEAETGYGEIPVAEEMPSDENYGEVTYEEAGETDEVHAEVSEEPAVAESGFAFVSPSAVEEEALVEDEISVEGEASFDVEVSEPEVANELPYVGETTSDHSFTTSESFGTVDFEETRIESNDLPVVEPVEEPQPSFAPAAVSEPVVETVGAQQSQSRLSSRNVDLPIEVAEEDRRMHNDARRFARLLVSEIKLYNEQKVSEGREAGDLYDRLREAIDRSREMYSKRVHAPVAAKFDYFHYELVNSLGEGDAGRLGSNYPGATV